METSQNLKVYPNPASDHLSISLYQYHNDARLYIYDALGKEVYRNETMYLDEEVDVSHLTAGTYTIRILSPDGDLTDRFVVR